MNDRETESVIRTAIVQSNFIGNAAIRQSLQRDQLRPADMRRTLISLFLILPGNRLITDGKWFRLVVSALISELMQYYHGLRVTMLLDEFANLGPMPQIEVLTALGRGYRIRPWVFVQSLTQLQKLYQENFLTFEANAGVRQYLQVKDLFTARHVSEYCGDNTVAVPNVSVSQVSMQQYAQGFSGVSASYSLTKIPEVLPQEVLRQPRNRQFIFFDRVPYVTHAGRVPYWQDARFKAKALPDPYHDLEGALRRAALNPPPRPLSHEKHAGSSLVPTLTRDRVPRPK
jgi:type IV secretion system protein VirD4